MNKLTQYTNKIKKNIINEQKNNILHVKKIFYLFVKHKNDSILIFHNRDDLFLCYAIKSINLISKNFVNFIRENDYNFFNFKIKRINIDTSIISFEDISTFNIVLYNITLENDFNKIKNTKKQILYIHHITNVLSNPIYNDSIIFPINIKLINEFYDIINNIKDENSNINYINNINEIYEFSSIFADNMLFLYNIDNVGFYIFYETEYIKIFSFLEYVKKNKNMYYVHSRSNVNFMGNVYSIYINKNLKFIVYDNKTCIFRDTNNKHQATIMYKIKYMLLDIIFWNNIKSLSFLKKIKIKNIYDIEIIPNVKNKFKTKYSLYYKSLWMSERPKPQLYHFKFHKHMK